MCRGGERFGTDRSLLAGELWPLLLVINLFFTKELCFHLVSWCCLTMCQETVPPRYNVCTRQRTIFQRDEAHMLGLAGGARERRSGKRGDTADKMREFCNSRDDVCGCSFPFRLPHSRENVCCGEQGRGRVAVLVSSDCVCGTLRSAVRWTVVVRGRRCGVAKRKRVGPPFVGLRCTASGVLDT